jgi:hypothetical protein
MYPNSIQMTNYTYQKLKFKVWNRYASYLSETRDTQMCRDSMVENHWTRPLQPIQSDLPRSTT